MGQGRLPCAQHFFQVEAEGGHFGSLLRLGFRDLRFFLLDMEKNVP